MPILSNYKTEERATQFNPLAVISLPPATSPFPDRFSRSRVAKVTRVRGLSEAESPIDMRKRAIETNEKQERGARSVNDAANTRSAVETKHR